MDYLNVYNTIEKKIMGVGQLWGYGSCGGNVTAAINKTHNPALTT